MDSPVRRASSSARRCVSGFLMFSPMCRPFYPVMHTLLPHFVAGSKRVWRHPLRPALRRTGLFSGLFFCGFAKGYSGTFAALIDELAADVSIARKISLQSRDGEIWAAD